jgi:hypothetical protein
MISRTWVPAGAGVVIAPSWRMKILVAAIVLAIVAASLTGSVVLAERSLQLSATILLGGIAASMLVVFGATRAS